MRARTLGLTAAALVAFAANSWLCRAALRAGAIDPVSFTAVRLASGAAVLALLVARRRGAPEARARGDWGSAAALVAYALPFALAYVRLDAATGALVLFPTVQLTMLAGGFLAGDRPGWLDGAGMVLAVGGLALLFAPARAAPELPALAGMALAGVAWGLYSLRGRGVAQPLAATAGNFARTLPAIALALAVAAPTLGADARGLALAALSGAVASALGYVAWYAALPALRPLVAGLVQLAAPVLAAAGGVALLGEPLTARLVGAGTLVLGGLALAITATRRRAAAARRAAT